MTVLDTLTAERAKYGPRISPADAIAILMATAAQHPPDLGLLAKPIGNNWDGLALDILFDRVSGHIFDVFIDGPDASAGVNGTAQPSWQDKGLMDPSRWVAPGVAPPPTPVPVPLPPAPSVDLRPVLEAIAALAAKVDAWKPPAFPAYSGKVSLPFVGERTVTLRPEK